MAGHSPTAPPSLWHAGTDLKREREKGVRRERQIIEEYNYCGQDKDNGCNPDTA